MANLLRVDIYELTDALTQKSMILRGEEIQSPLSVEQVGQLGDVYIIYIYIYIYICIYIYIYIYMYIYIYSKAIGCHCIFLGNSWRTFTETLRISGVNLDVVEISIPCKK